MGQMSQRRPFCGEAAAVYTTPKFENLKLFVGKMLRDCLLKCGNAGWRVVVAVGLVGFLGAADAEMIQSAEHETVRESLHPLSLAVVNSYGDEITDRLFRQSMEAIGRAVRPRPLQVTFYGPDEFLAAADAGEFDLSFASSGLSSLMISRTNGIPLLSIATDLMPDPNQGNGAAVIVRADRTDLTELEDLRGGTVSVMSRTAFAGWQIPLVEMMRQGISPAGFFGEVRVTGAPMTRIVEDVRHGRSDAGFLLTCLLENLEETGYVRPGEFRVVNEQHHEGAGCRHSSALYPNWLLTVKPTVSADEARSITQALLDLAPGRTGIRWTVPTDHRRIYSFFEMLDMPLSGAAASAQMIRRGWPWVIGGLFAVLFLIVHSVLLSVVIRRRTSEAARAMKEKMASDLAARETTLRLEALQKASAVGLVSGMVAHELKQPLTVINNYAGSILQRLARGREVPTETLEMAMREIVRSGMSASEIIEKIRSYARSDAQVHHRTRVVETVRECVRRMGSRPGVEGRLRLEVPAAEYSVDMDPLELKLVVGNLIRNAAEVVGRAADGGIVVSVAADDKHVTIGVADNGPRLSDEAFARIGEVGYTTKATGLGLGIPIICSLLEVHGAALEFKRLEPQGIAALVRIERIRDNDGKARGAPSGA